MSNELRRVITLPMLVLYGLGNILGAGIYVLVGEVAGAAGYRAPLAFVVAAVLVVPTALAYAELSSRFPLSAGESVYLHEAFGRRWLAVAAGLMVALAGMISTATLVNGFAGYLSVFAEVPRLPLVALLVAALGGLCAWGIGESVRIAALLTLVEIAGLLLVIWVGASADGVPTEAPTVPWSGIVLGAFLAFFAFIGFEDMVNVAEEVRDPQRNLPRAILAALAVATVLYVLVALAALRTLTPAQLAASGAPLAEVFRAATGSAPLAITFIGLVAALNGALVQIIMAARIAYGMSRKGWLPAPLSRVSPRTATPVIATVAVSSIVLLLAAALPLLVLAQLTSAVVLAMFMLMNAALWRIKLRQPRPPGGGFLLPLWVPVAGLLGSVGFAVAALVAALS